MKKLFISLTMMCLGMIPSMAEVTDVSSIDNVVYLNPVTASAGTRCVLSVQMKNTDAITGYEFYMQLPEGLSFAKDEDDFYLTALSLSRTTARKTNYFDCTVNEEGLLHVLCSTTAADPVTENLYTFNGNDGEVCTVTITIPQNYETGTYPILLKEIVLTPSAADKGYEKDLLETSITITAPEDNRVILDETSSMVPEASNGEVGILVKRTIKASEWSTICLPFDMTEAQVYEAFGNDVQLAEFTDYEAEYDNDNVVGLTVNFDETNLSEGFYGNYPYLIRTSKDITEFEVTTSITPDEKNTVAEYDNGRTGKNRKVYGSFIGTYHAGDVIPAKGLFLSSNKFYYSTGSTKLKAFRGYFQFNDVLSDVEDIAEVKFAFYLDGIETRVNELVPALEDESIYDLSGRKVSRPQKSGVYIVNGRKALIK